MSDVTTKSRSKSAGIIPAVVACVFAILGIFLLGIVFVPLASIFALAATLTSLKNFSLGGICLTIAAWILIVIAFFTSPALMAAIAGIIGASSM